MDEQASFLAELGSSEVAGVASQVQSGVGGAAQPGGTNKGPARGGLEAEDRAPTPKESTLFTVLVPRGNLSGTRKYRFTPILSQVGIG